MRLLAFILPLGLAVALVSASFIVGYIIAEIAK